MHGVILTILKQHNLLGSVTRAPMLDKSNHVTTSAVLTKQASSKSSYEAFDLNRK